MPLTYAASIHQLTIRITYLQVCSQLPTTAQAFIFLGLSNPMGSHSPLQGHEDQGQCFWLTTFLSTTLRIRSPHSTSSELRGCPAMWRHCLIPNSWHTPFTASATTWGLWSESISLRVPHRENTCSTSTLAVVTPIVLPYFKGPFLVLRSALLAAHGRQLYTNSSTSFLNPGHPAAHTLWRVQSTPWYTPT